ncbi:MAG: trypsin-like peptidase domain-containing protein [Planctomycetota bacterium]
MNGSATYGTGRRLALAGIVVGVLAYGCVEVWAGESTTETLALVKADEARRVAMLERLIPCVVCIFPDRAAQSGGSGVIIDPRGYGLTNFHVITPCLETRRGYGGLADGKLYPLEVLGIDPGGDIAMFKLGGRESFEFAELGDAEELVPGQWVAALGNPFGLAEDFIPAVTLGVVSGLHRYQYGQGNLLEYADCIQVSTSINPGNSGGPVVDMRGRVVGIAGRGSFEERGRVNVGLGYAVTANQIKRFMPALQAGLLCRHGTLGATVRRAGDELIFGAIQGLSPAERGGVELGDVLLAVNGRAVRTPNDYNNALAVLPADWPVELRLRRGEREIAARTRLERLPLREMPLFIPNRARNVAEVVRVLESFTSRGPTIIKSVAPVLFDVEVSQVEGETYTLRIEFRKSEDELEQVIIKGVDNERELPALIETAGREWVDLVTPLLWIPKALEGWEALGGDEVDGRLVAVVEKRCDDACRLRWMFAWDTHELVRLAVTDGEGMVTATWQPSEESARRIPILPYAWRRVTSNPDTEFKLRVLGFEAQMEPGDANGEGGP